MKKYIYRPAKFSLPQLKLIQLSGGVGLCPICRAEIIIVASKADADETGKAIGVHCSENESHIEPICVNVTLEETEQNMYSISAGEEEFFFFSSCNDFMAAGSFVSWKLMISSELNSFQIEEIFAVNLEELEKDLKLLVKTKFGAGVELKKVVR